MVVGEELVPREKHVIPLLKQMNAWGLEGFEITDVTILTKNPEGVKRRYKLWLEKPSLLDKIRRRL